MKIADLHEEGGFVRDLVKYLALLVVVAVLVFDTISLIQVQRTVRVNATDAANEALTTYIDSGNTEMAKDRARTSVEMHGSTFGGAEIVTSGGRTHEGMVKVTASRSADTYVFRYLAEIPRIGEPLKDALNPTVTETSD